MTMQVKSETQTGFRAQIGIVPQWAWALAAALFVVAQIFFNIVLAGKSSAPPVWGRLLMGLAAGIVAGCYWLFVGYVTSDARRRGMSPVLWALVVILIPNCLGFILYFILRQPLRKGCPQCGSGVQTGFNFCPQCNYKLSPNCPQCQRVVGVNDVYCPYCGTSLREPAVR
jgi:RNA polymerase subunit RPABC4/transcription elongation factor Spt4